MTTIDIALTNVDINQCNKESGGQFQFEIFAGTHRCKNETTQVRSRVGKGREGLLHQKSEKEGDVGTHPSPRD